MDEPVFWHKHKSFICCEPVIQCLIRIKSCPGVMPYFELILKTYFSYRHQCLRFCWNYWNVKYIYESLFLCEKYYAVALFCGREIEMDSGNLVPNLRWNADYDAWLDSFLIPQIYCFKSTVLSHDSIIQSILQAWLSTAKYLTIWEPCVTHLFWFGKTIVSHP